MSRQPYIELLAPAKNLATARAAIDCGADAVYMGGPKLGARAGATNSMADIAEAARYAHRYGARLYLTLNTIVYEHEIDQAREIAHQAIEAGVDALIVQDPAYLTMGLEGIELHASTQLYNASPERAAFWGRSGFSRIVLERGLMADEMEAICRATDAEVEVFVHGAICVSGSGRCYMSRSLSHRSGNRGECSQPCRQTYDLVDGTGRVIRRGEHLLSVNDMDMSAHIGELIDMGVCSLKIEGRLKDEAYVRNITAHYSTLIDKALATRKGLRRASWGRCDVGFEPSPSKTFTRHGGDYVFRGRRATLASFGSPKAMGSSVGKVVRTGRGWFELAGGGSGKARFVAGDGICFLSGGKLVGTNINSVEGNRLTPNKMDGITVGTEIFRNFDKGFYDALRRASSRRWVDAELLLSYGLGGLRVEARSEGGSRVEAVAEGPFEPAAKPEVARSNMAQQMQKSGDSHYRIKTLEIAPVGASDSEVPFVPIGTLNSLRRNVLELLAEADSTLRPPKYIPTIDPSARYPERHIGGDHNVVNSLSRRFYTDHGVERVEEGYDLWPDLKGVEVMRTPYCIRREIGHCLLKGSKLPEPLSIIHGEESFRLRFDCKRCTMYVIKN